MKKLTEQQFFELCVKRLWKQGKMSFSEEHNICVYYDEITKNRCAIGIMIPKRIAERLSLDSIVNLESVAFDKYMERRLEGYDAYERLEGYPTFLATLQQTHDSKLTWYSLEDFKEAWKTAGEKLGLNVSFLEKLTIKETKNAKR